MKKGQEIIYWKGMAYAGGYRTVRHMLDSLDRDFKSASKTAEYLGVCAQSVLAKRRSLGLPIRLRGGNNNPNGTKGKGINSAYSVGGV